MALLLPFEKIFQLIRMVVSDSVETTHEADNKNSSLHWFIVRRHFFFLFTWSIVYCVLATVGYVGSLIRAGKTPKNSVNRCFDTHSTHRVPLSIAFSRETSISDICTRLSQSDNSRKHVFTVTEREWNWRVMEMCNWAIWCSMNVARSKKKEKRSFGSAANGDDDWLALRYYALDERNRAEFSQLERERMNEEKRFSTITTWANEDAIKEK